MDGEVLVAYGSWAGSTAEVAEMIGQAMQEKGITVSVCPANTVFDLSKYQAVVLGSAVRARRLHPDVRAFVAIHEQALSALPVAYFVVSMTMTENTPENRSHARAYLNNLIEKHPHIRPVSIGLFGGVMDPDNVHGAAKLIVKLMMKAVKNDKNDFRDPAVIHAWADSLPAALNQD